jgi:hypothetical protein
MGVARQITIFHLKLFFMINIYKQKRRSLWHMGLVFLLAFSALLAQAQEVVVTGKVTDAETQQGLPGVSIRIDGTTSGTITDAEGNFKFNSAVTPGSYSLIASFIGYKTSKNALVVDNQTSYEFTIALAEDVLKLDEVIVTGLGTTSEKRKIGNLVSRISQKDF